MSEVQNRIVGIIGRKGTGKSSRLQEMLGFCPHFVVFDVMGEHARQNEINRFASPEQLARFLKWSRREDTFAAVYVPGGDLEEEIEEVSRLVYARGHLCFVCEEVPLYTQAGYMPPLFGKLIRTGRHQQIDIAWTGTAGRRGAEDADGSYGRVGPLQPDRAKGSVGTSRPLRAGGSRARGRARAARLFHLGRDGA